MIHLAFEALGETWTLRFNTNALCEFEGVTGTPITQVAQGGAVTLSSLRALLWAGLGHHHSNIRLARDGFADAAQRQLEEVQIPVRYDSDQCFHAVCFCESPGAMR